MFYLRFALAVLGFVAASAYGFGLLLVRRDRSVIPHKYAQMLGRLLLPAFGIRVVVQGEENLYAQRPCVYLANHQSLADVPVLGSIYPPGAVVIGKQQLRGIPLFGWLYTATGNILIDRSDRAQSVGRLKEAEEAIRTRGVSVWIFPEGTRTPVPGELLPFKKGAFYMAISAGVPLVPVVVSPLNELMDFRRRRSRPGTAEIRVLAPIPTTGLTESDVTSLMHEAHSRMSAVLRELTARRTPWLLERQDATSPPGSARGG